MEHGINNGIQKEKTKEKVTKPLDFHIVLLYNI